MTFATSLAFYAMIKSHLKEPLTYPGTFESYIATHDASPAGFLAEFNVWCATTPEAGGRVFNAVGGDTWVLFGVICGTKGAQRSFFTSKNPQLFVVGSLAQSRRLLWLRVPRSF